MKKLLLSLALLTAVAAVHADEQANTHRKNTRAYLKHSPKSVGNLPISDKAKVTEHENLVSKGVDLHDSMAQDEDGGHQDLRMPAVQKHVEKHAGAAQALKGSASTGSFSGRPSRSKRIQSQD